jgi:hypothetical protein
MGRKRWLVALFILSLALPLVLATRTWAAPNLLGTWKGTAPKITLSGCSSDTFVVTITTQCTNLFSGTVAIGDTPVPVVGRFFPNENVLTLQGEYMSPQYDFIVVSLNGVYVAGNPPSITVDTTSYMSTDINLYNVEYDTFSLIKQ